MAANVFCLLMPFARLPVDYAILLISLSWDYWYGGCDRCRYHVYESIVYVKQDFPHCEHRQMPIGV